ncbi:hypothetical protein [Acetobacterium malicum]|uniref:hypothetical protein n=1 Tax=Acetobacterium malicum TaxID=52692 RepID=UPI000409C115|nr:hypothetical protein [Acetobacterium dehalogenans]
MIYVFENPNNGASIVYDETTLTTENKAKGIALESLPVPEMQAGKIPVLKCEKATERVWYDYVDEPKSAEDERITALEEALAEIILSGGAM